MQFVRFVNNKNNLRRQLDNSDKVVYNYARHAHSMSTTGRRRTRKRWNPQVNSQELIMNNEMVVEHGRQAVALRDEHVAEMKAAINELSESLVKKDEIIEQKDHRIRDQADRIKLIADDYGHRSMLSAMEADNLKFEIQQLREINEAEVADREYKLERIERDLAERKELRGEATADR